MTHPIPDERLTAPAVREWSSIRATQLSKDRTEAAKALYKAGMSCAAIADVLGMRWRQVDQIVRGEAE